MKNFLYILLLLIGAMSSCVSGDNYQDVQHDLDYLEVIRIDDCEYFQYRQYMYFAIEHKGDCDNPIHYR